MEGGRNLQCDSSDGFGGVIISDISRLERGVIFIAAIKSK
jgi:hypothetical protein